MSKSIQTLLTSSVLLATLLTSIFFGQESLARGGTSVSDGGQGVICNGTPLVLDYYEAVHLLGTSTSVVPLDALPLLFVSRLTHLLPKTHPLIRHLNVEYGNFTTGNVYVDDSLISIEDYVAPFVPLEKTCKIFQAAITLHASSAYIYVVHSSFFEPGNEIQRDILVFHETLHPYFKTSGDNRAIRQLVISLLADDEFREKNAALIRKVIESKKFIPWNEFKF